MILYCIFMNWLCMFTYLSSNWHAKDRRLYFVCFPLYWNIQFFKKFMSSRHQRGFLCQQMGASAKTTTRNTYIESLNWMSLSGPTSWGSGKSHVRAEEERLQESEGIKGTKRTWPTESTKAGLHWLTTMASLGRSLVCTMSSVYMLGAWCLCGSGNRYVWVYGCSWNSFPPIELPYTASIWGLLSCLIISFFFSC